MPIRPNYLGHDDAYKRYKKSGRPGWSDEKVLQENVAELSRVLARLNPPQGAKILELGCGAGNLSIALAQRGFQVTGIDISPAAIEWANENAAALEKRPNFIVGDVLALPEANDGFFDYVLDGYCLHCIIGEDRPIFLRNAHRVLRPLGVLHIATMCDDYRGSMPENYDRISRCTVVNGIGVRYFGPADSILAEVRKAGFTIAFSVVECDSPADQAALRVDCVKA